MTTKIRKLSKKRAKQNREYLILRAEHLERFPWCWRCGVMATQIHHKKGRVGDLLTDEKFFVSLCARCHDFVENHPKWAKEQGFSLSRL